MSHGALAVTVHDVEPATFARCALIRDWLDDHGVDRVTLLVIPAPDLHPFADRRPELLDWLLERERRGDAIAQHGLCDSAHEFSGLSPRDTRRTLDSGRRLLKLAGIEPRGFVAPAYAYTPALRATLCERFTWWAGRLGLHDGRGSRFAPAFGLGAAGDLRQVASPLLLRAGARLAGPVLRLDLHPVDLDHPRRVLALEHVLRGCAHGRTSVTLDEVCA